MVFSQESRIPIDLIFRKNEVNQLNPSIEERTAMAVKRIRHNQLYNKVKYDKRRTNETFKRGEFVLWRQEPRTNLALDEHAKLISPWYGPVTIFKDIGQNKYVIIDDEANPKTINVENLKKYQKRPDWMKDDVPEEMEVDGNIIVSPATAPSVEDKGKDIPAIEPIISPKEVQAESMDVEGPTNVRRSTREKKYVPKKDDKIDMRFYNTKDKKKYWSCGTVIKIDKEDENRIYFKFLDETNEDWYDLRDEDLEIRRCIQSNTHNRSAAIKILNIQESAQNPKESEEKRKKRRMRQKEEGARAQRKKTKTNG
jgi:hypothetical protein